MDARTERIATPLAVDLDGTLIATDLLWESVFLLLRRNPLYLFLLPVWLLSGKAHLKCEIAERVEIDPAGLPYRPEILRRLAEDKAAGRHIALATAQPRKFAEVVAAHLGFFDKVISTDRGCNMTSGSKRRALVEAYGDGGFDYAGNEKADIAVFEAARAAIVVAPDTAAARWHARHGGELVAAPRPTLRTMAKMLRAHQWLKNTLIAVPLVLSHEYFNPAAVVACALAFISFSSAASAIYILNDLFDLSLDRAHPTKRNRPFASGVLSIPFGFAAIGALLAFSFAVALWLPPLFMLVLCGYLAATTAYSLSFKRMLLIDVFALSGLYTIRILAGGVATNAEWSFWLLAFSIFFFLSLALVKRYVELRGTDVPPGERMAGRGYRPEDLETISQAGMAAAFSAALVMAMFIDSEAATGQYSRPWLMWPLAPLILYLTMRLWILARRDTMHDDPVVFIIRDWRSQLVGGFGILLLLAAGM
ncbi:UbiA family prenyltransferase [Aquamicrobium sp. LC103]|uniref:UbiA family prenyltransferase n=1 Tax=Aquamicrobium sp. LC103 TaxID=1120658 RepID=UPI00063EBDBF|nr:UbiA family prenyltransferase [Aquamicrobium sp. LC103]TKT80416.1 UbiA family prenyltransferase [Aquamicrobium sp. LC103]